MCLTVHIRVYTVHHQRVRYRIGSGTVGYPRSLTVLITDHSKYEITVPLTWRSVIQWIRSITRKVTIIGAENPTRSAPRPNGERRFVGGFSFLPPCSPFFLLALVLVYEKRGGKDATLAKSDTSDSLSCIWSATFLRPHLDGTVLRSRDTPQNV